MVIDWPQLILAMIGLACVSWLVLMTAVYLGTRKLACGMRRVARGLLIQAEGLDARESRVQALAKATMEVRV